jgi:ABC-2 type transport system permease protein
VALGHPADRAGVGMSAGLQTGVTSLKLAFQSEIERRANFLLQMAMMAVNDIIFLIFWLLVYSHKDTIKGWDRSEMLIVFAALAIGVGFGIGFGNGLRRLSLRISAGDLDPLLVQPRSVLPRVITARVYPPGIGDMVFGLLLFAYASDGSLDGWARFLGACTLGGIIVLAFMLMWESLAFWGDSGGKAAGVAFTGLAVMGIYPSQIFPGAMKLVVFTVIPAAFVGSVPAEIALHPSMPLVVSILVGAVTMWAVAAAMFHAGLRRYMRAD